MEDKKITNNEMDVTELSDDLAEDVNGGAAEAGCRKPRKIRKQIESDSARSCLGAVVIYI